MRKVIQIRSPEGGSAIGKMTSPTEAYLSSLNVPQEFQGRGIGTKLSSQFIQEARNRGATSITSHLESAGSVRTFNKLFPGVIPKTPGGNLPTSFDFKAPVSNFNPLVSLNNPAPSNKASTSNKIAFSYKPGMLKNASSAFFKGAIATEEFAASKLVSPVARKIDQFTSKQLPSPTFVPQSKTEGMIYDMLHPKHKVAAMEKVGSGLLKTSEGLANVSKWLESKGPIGQVAGLATTPLEIGATVSGKLLTNQRLQNLSYNWSERNRGEAARNLRKLGSRTKDLASLHKSPVAKFLGKAAWGGAKLAARSPIAMGTLALGAGILNSALGDVDNTMATTPQMKQILESNLGAPLGFAAMAALSSRDRTNDLQGTDLAMSMTRKNNPQGPMSFGGGGSTMGGGRNYSMGASGDLTLALNNLRRGR